MTARCEALRRRASVQREAAAQRVAEERCRRGEEWRRAAASRCRSRRRGGSPSRDGMAEEAVQAGDHHSSSYLAHARRLASASGRSSVTRSSMPHIAAQ